MEIEISNCNNIENGKIIVEKNKLNIKYGMNGTGKSTIAKAIANRDNLSSLKTLGNDVEPKIRFDDEIKKVLLFDDKFIQDVTFNGSEVIENSFEVFIKTDEYDIKRKEINDILGSLNKETFDNPKITELNSLFWQITSKIQLNSNCTVKNNPAYKSITQKNNVFDIPQSLNKYSEFISDMENNIVWVEWKNRGFQFDQKEKCPFCADKFTNTYREEKESFQGIFTKANVKNLSEIYLIISNMKKFLNDNEYVKIIECIQQEKEKETIDLIFQKFIIEVLYLEEKLRNIQSFDSYKIKNSELDNLEEKVRKLKINKEELVYFSDKYMFSIIDEINEKIERILKKIRELQAKVAILNTFIQKAVEKSKDDINKFLETAGFNYEFDFKVDDEGIARTLLIYKGKEKADISDIEEHLSWGEKNAFALVLFMYYALSEKTDLIILDDPISSFDSNKKYAIINRLFANRTDKNSFFNKTVLMLTHDFEPIIDFIVNGKPNGGYALASYIKNSSGIISETEIKKNEDILSIMKFTYKYAINNKLNIISRINFLRKYIEHISIQNENILVYDMLSSLIHGKEYPDKQVSRDNYIKFSDDEYKNAETVIRKYITNFEYLEIHSNYYNKEFIIAQYFAEENNYIKLQMFREYLEITEERNKIDDNLLKFIDEIYHIENDYLFSLDLIKYNTVPDYIVNRIKTYMEEKKGEI